MGQTVTYTLAFAIVAIAAHRIGRWFTAVGLPYITGYLAAGAVAGSFALELLPTGAAEDLRFIDEISLGVIAFVAGSELFLPDLRERARTIATMSASIAVVGSVVLGVAIFVLTGMLDFTSGLGGSERLAVALLGAAVLLALSPPSTIAVIKEVGARGPFTSTALSITIVMDVVVIASFAAAASVAAAVLQGAGLDAGFVGVLLLDLVLAGVAGYALGRGLGWVLAQGMPPLATAAVVMAAGYAVYEVASFVEAWTLTNLPFSIYVSPLLLTLVAGFTVTNATDQRAAFEDVLHRISPAVYVAFFTLTGLSLQLDTLVVVLPAALLLFVVRVAAIAVGAGLGARLAGQGGALASRSWMALITQAGIALGLARQAGVQFPELGDAFTTLVIAVVVLNEILGPMFLKSVLGRVGEVAEERIDHSAVIYGIDRNAQQLARRLSDDGWDTVLADDHEVHVEMTEERGGAAILVTQPLALLEQVGETPDAVVAMSADDHANLAVCRSAVEAGVTTTVARVRDATLLPEFHELGTLVVDPTSAAVALLEEAVRTPDAASLVLHADDARDTLQVTVRAVGSSGRQLRDLRLPPDVLVLTVRRGGSAIVPDGFTRIRRGDDLTLLGRTAALREAAARLGS